MRSTLHKPCTKKTIPEGCGVFGFQLALPSLLWLYHLPLFDCGDRGEAALASSAVIICGGRQTGDAHANM